MAFASFVASVFRTGVIGRKGEERGGESHRRSQGNFAKYSDSNESNSVDKFSGY